MSTSDVLTKNLQELEKEKPVIRRMITEVFNQINEKTIDAYDLVKKTLELAKRVADYRAKFKASADYGREHGLPFDSEKYELINTDYHQKLDKIYEVADKTKQDIKKINIFEMTIQDDATKAKNEPSKSNITNQQVQQETITMTTEAEPKTMPEKFILKEIEKIKPFSGKFLDFRKFFESLTSLLDLSCLPPQRKIDIIAEKLDGPSRQLINSMGDEDDYDKVKTILREKFYDPYEVVLHIAQQLRSLPKLTNNFDIMGMERILEDIKKTEKLMTKVNINPAYTYQFKRIIYQKLTYEIVSKLGCVSETDLSTIVEVLEKEHKLARSRREDHNLFDDFLSCGPIVKTSPQRQNTRSTYCYFCSSPTHTSVDCRARIPLKTKRNIIWEKNLCIRCLEKGHRMSNCGSERVCRICRGGHHEILCQTPQQDNPRCTNQSNVNKGNYRSITSPQRKMIEYPQRQSNTPRTKVKESYVCETMNTTSNDMRSQVQQNSDTNERKEMKNTKPDDYEVQTMEDELIGLSNLESNMLHMMMAKTETTDMAKRKDLEEPVVVKAQVNGFEQELMIDSGANISFITPMYVKKLLLKEKPSNENIFTLGSNVHIKGICTTTVKIENIEHEVKFYVVPHEKDIIALGRDAMRSFGISIIPEDENKWKVQINIGQGKEKDVEDHDIGKLLKKYKDVFAKNKEDIGCIKNAKCACYWYLDISWSPSSSIIRHHHQHLLSVCL